MSLVLVSTLWATLAVVGLALIVWGIAEVVVDRVMRKERARRFHALADSQREEDDR